VDGAFTPEQQGRQIREYQSSTNRTNKHRGLHHLQAYSKLGWYEHLGDW